ncbi:MAG: DUF4435 domain-containing protein [Pseudomonadota bacterium]
MSSSLYQTVDEIVTEIALSQDSTPWLIIEGSNDERFFITRSLPKSPKIISADGWANVLSVVSKVSEESIAASVIGFVDRDHREDVGITIDHDNIVVTDYRDIEISMFESGALHRILVEFGSPQKLPKLSSGTVDINTVKNSIYEVAEALGRLRFYSLKNDLNLSFQDLNYNKFIDTLSLTINSEILVAQINSKSKSKITIDKYNESLSCPLPERLKDCRNLNSGHDVVEILGISLRKKWGTKSAQIINRENLEKSFRIGYSDQEFQDTNMYKTLCTLLEK